MMLCRPCSIAALCCFLQCCLLLVAGCNSNPFAQSQPLGFNTLGSSSSGATATAGSATVPTSTELADLERRVRALDDNNRMLTAQLAQVQQQGDLYKERAALLQKQLGDMTAQVQSSKQDASRLATAPVTNQPRGIQASSTTQSGATLTANSSMARQAGSIQIPGATTEVDGDTIRIRIPADQIFASGTDQLNGSASNILDPVANTISKMYPKQRVGIEGHADDGPLYGGSFSSPLQLSTAQAMQVVDYLTKRNQLAPNQLFTIGHGTNHPRASNQSAIGRAENRRIEIVIYPTTF